MRCDLLKVSIACLALLFVSFFGNGCGNNPSLYESAAPTTSNSTVIIFPESVEIKRGASWKFSAAVANKIDPAVTWSIQLSS
jgi:hypothetical protein